MPQPKPTLTPAVRRVRDIAVFLLVACIAAGLGAIWLGILLFCHGILAP